MNSCMNKILNISIYSVYGSGYWLGRIVKKEINLKKIKIAFFPSISGLCRVTYLISQYTANLKCSILFHGPLYI